LHISKTDHHYYYFFNGRQINDACVVSDRGIEIDSSLKYDAHINKIVGKAYSRIGVLFKAFTTRHSSLKESVLDLCKTCSGIPGIHCFRDNEVSLRGGYDVIVISPLGGASGDFS